MYYAENSHQPDKFSSIPNAMYWSLITLTTVGYGDVSPVTSIGKIISMVTAFLGVSIVAMLTGIVASAFTNQVARKKVILEDQIREAMKDGILDENERRVLEKMRLEYWHERSTGRTDVPASRTRQSLTRHGVVLFPIELSSCFITSRLAFQKYQ